MRKPRHVTSRARGRVALLAMTLLAVCAVPPAAKAAPTVARPLIAAPAQAPAAARPNSGSASSGGSLEAAASKAGELGRKVAMSLIALGLSFASVVLIFRRRFRDAAGVFAVGFTAVLLASPAGVNVLRDTVKLLFGA